MVVLSESMEPAMHRGDLIVLWTRGSDTSVGQIVVYNVEGRDVPIVLEGRAVPIVLRVVKRFGGG
jgi:signal peptidase